MIAQAVQYEWLKLVDAARDLGADYKTIILKVIIPYINWHYCRVLYGTDLFNFDDLPR